MSPSDKPFDEKRYKALTDGRLKTKGCAFSYVLKATDYFRLEADYFISDNVSGDKFEPAINYISKVQYGTSESLNEEKKGYPILRLNEFQSYFIKHPEKYCDVITKQQYEDLKLHKGDILICRTNGNPDLVGRAAVVMRDYDYAFASYLFRVNVNDNITPECFVAYLQSKYGRSEIDKNSMKGNQTNFSPAKLKDIKVPILSKEFSCTISGLFERSFNLLNEFQSLYSMASTIVETRIGNPNWTKRDSINVKPLSNSFLQSGRLDAEYYQPKYEKITESLNTNETVSSLCNLYNDNYVPKAEKAYRYIELANVGESGELNNVETKDGIELPTRARRLVKRGQVMVSSIEGSLNSCALITDDYDGAICSTGFYVVDSEKINSETLLVLFKSAPIQELLKQRCSGTILTAIGKDEFLAMPLPFIPESVQNEIAAKVQESFALRKESKRLLDLAVKAVEMAIETDEESALLWLELQN